MMGWKYHFPNLEGKIDIYLRTNLKTDGAWESSLITWINKKERPWNDNKNLIAELLHERVL